MEFTENKVVKPESNRDAVLSNLKAQAEYWSHTAGKNPSQDIYHGKADGVALIARLYESNPDITKADILVHKRVDSERGYGEGIPSYDLGFDEGLNIGIELIFEK